MTDTGLTASFIFSFLFSAGGALIWMKLIIKADPGWKKKQHRWILYIIAGVGSAFLSLLFYRAAFFITGGGFYSMYAAADDFWFYILINGPAEEWAKFLVFLLIAKGFNKVKEPRDGVLVAMMVALGFSFYENILYINHFGNIGERIFFSSSGHMSYAAVWGYFTGSVILSGEGKINIILSVSVIAFIHGLFNFLLSWVGITAGLILDAVIYIITLAILYSVLKIPGEY